jgi:hypothetical protein
MQTRYYIGDYLNYIYKNKTRGWSKHAHYLIKSNNDIISIIDTYENELHRSFDGIKYYTKYE